MQHTMDSVSTSAKPRRDSWQETEMSSRMRVQVLPKLQWASQCQIRESHFK